MNRFVYATANLLGDRDNIVEIVNTVEKEPGLVTPHAPNSVTVSHTHPDSGRHRRQHDVPSKMSVGVVKGLEMIDIAECDTQVGSRGALTAQRRIEAGDCLGAVHQPGQCVVPGQVLQSLFRLDFVVDNTQREITPSILPLESTYGFPWPSTQ